MRTHIQWTRGCLSVCARAVFDAPQSGLTCCQHGLKEGSVQGCHVSSLAGKQVVDDIVDEAQNPERLHGTPCSHTRKDTEHKERKLLFGTANCLEFSSISSE